MRSQGQAAAEVAGLARGHPAPLAWTACLGGWGTHSLPGVCSAETSYVELGTGGTYLWGSRSSLPPGCLLWALMLVGPWPPLRPLFICDLVCPYDGVCVLLCLVSFHLSLLLFLSLSVSLLPVSPKTIRNS